MADLDHGNQVVSLDYNALKSERLTVIGEVSKQQGGVVRFESGMFASVEVRPARDDRGSVYGTIVDLELRLGNGTTVKSPVTVDNTGFVLGKPAENVLVNTALLFASRAINFKGSVENLNSASSALN